MMGSDPKSMQEAVLAVVREECAKLHLTYSPEMLLNGDRAFWGEEAEDLIYAAAARIGLSPDEIERLFPYGSYFEPGGTVALWPLQLIGRLFRKPPTYQPLTAQGFAELLVRLKQTPPS